MESPENNKTEIIRQIDEINDKLWNFRGSPSLVIEDPFRMGNDALEWATQLDYEYGKARALLNMGMGSFIILHDANLSLKQLNESLDIFKAIDNKKWIANAQLTLAIIYNTVTKPEPALYNALRGIDFYLNNESEGADRIMAFYVIGTVYKDLKKYDESEKYYQKGISVPDDGISMWAGRIYTGLANIYTEQEKYEDAIKMSLLGLNLLRNQNNQIGISRALTELGFLYKRQKKYDDALRYYFEGLEIREKSNLKQFALGSFIEISSVYNETNEKEKAIYYLKKAAEVAIDVNQPAKLAKIYQDIGCIYKSLGDFESALHYTEKFLEITIDLTNKERESKIDNLQNTLLQEKEQEIERLKNVELKNAYTLISEKNKEITDSIQYAKRIQRTLLASDDLLKQNFPGIFVLYKPKDIVSGDFYWATSASNDLNSIDPKAGAGNNKSFYLAVCDSTGHGVPGAFMSLLNITFLNEAITEKKITGPAAILNHVRERLISAVSQEGGKDGMDGILIRMDQNDHLSGSGKIRITYSAANNMPILISDNELKELPYDKMPVGKGEKSDPFNQHTISLSKGDTFYLYTDGYADQFGGAKGKKFKYKQLNELLLSISKETPEMQHQMLDRKFEEWKGNLEQVDDVCIIGLQF